MLTPEDHVRRADILLYGPQGPAARDILPLLPPDQLQVAQVRMAYRAGSSAANDQANALPGNLSSDPGVAFERASFYRQRNLETWRWPISATSPPTWRTATWPTASGPSAIA